MRIELENQDLELRRTDYTLNKMNKTKIYLIDDNVAICEALTFLFDSVYNLKIKTYNNPLVFLEEFLPEWDGCLIIDLFMPFMNGIDLLRKLKQLNTNLHIIIISGHGTHEAARRSLEAGAAAFIPKPFKTEVLLEKIKTLLPLD
jgi:FixJ family two-component response regulator